MDNRNISSDRFIVLTTRAAEKLSADNVCGVTTIRH